MQERAVKDEDEPDAGWVTSTALTDDNEPTDGGEGNVVMKASRSEAARAAARADESNLPHARWQVVEPELRQKRRGGLGWG